MDCSYGPAAGATHGDDVVGGFGTNDLVANTKEAMGFPDVPGKPPPTGMMIGLMDYDFGPRLTMMTLPAPSRSNLLVFRQIIPALMLRVNSDGNEMVGAPSIQHLAPLGAYTGLEHHCGRLLQGSSLRRRSKSAAHPLPEHQN
jgi:hypothetical protein